MADPVYVTEVAEREKIYMGGMQIEIPLWQIAEEENTRGNFEQEKKFYEELKNWWGQFGEKMTFTFKSGQYFNGRGEKLFYDLYIAIKKRDASSIRRILPKMKEHCQTNYKDLNPIKKWAYTALQLPGDIGGPRKDDVRKLITSRAKGRVLETMCGFNSYFGDSPKISEVIALDYCEEMLERYARPERKRILFDLEKISNGTGMDFFEDESFQTIGCWGSNYLSNPISVFLEFHRILSKGGKFLILENTAEGYSDLVMRYFNPKACGKFMQQAGFSTTIEPLEWLKTKTELGDYSLVIGTK